MALPAAPASGLLCPPLQTLIDKYVSLRKEKLELVSKFEVGAVGGGGGRMTLRV